MSLAQIHLHIVLPAVVRERGHILRPPCSLTTIWPYDCRWQTICTSTEELRHGLWRKLGF